MKNLIEKQNPKTLGVEEQYKALLLQIATENEAISKIHKNTLTDNLLEADHQRDTTFSGLASMVKAAQNHFRQEVRESAKRIAVVFSKYGNVAIKPYDEESASINNLVAELEGNSAADAKLTNITEWIEELKANNDHFASLRTDRHSIEADKTQLKVKEERKKTDEIYRTIADRVNAQIIMNKEAAYRNFVNELNIRISSVTTVMAQHKKVNTKQEKVK